jgi:hypothetical protein
VLKMDTVFHAAAFCKLKNIEIIYDLHYHHCAWSNCGTYFTSLVMEQLLFIFFIQYEDKLTMLSAVRNRLPWS